MQVYKYPKKYDPPFDTNTCLQVVSLFIIYIIFYPDHDEVAPHFSHVQQQPPYSTAIAKQKGTFTHSLISEEVMIGGEREEMKQDWRLDPSLSVVPIFLIEFRGNGDRKSNEAKTGRRWKKKLRCDTSGEEEEKSKNHQRAWRRRKSLFRFIRSCYTNIQKLNSYPCTDLFNTIRSSENTRDRVQVAMFSTTARRVLLFSPSFLVITDRQSWRMIFFFFPSSVRPAADPTINTLRSVFFFNSFATSFVNNLLPFPLTPLYTRSWSKNTFTHTHTQLSTACLVLLRNHSFASAFATNAFFNHFIPNFSASCPTGNSPLCCCCLTVRIVTETEPLFALLFATHAAFCWRNHTLSTIV